MKSFWKKAAESRPYSGRPEAGSSTMPRSAAMAALCERVGTFVHHVPEAPDPERRDAEALTRTQQRIVEAGFPVDDALWLAPTDQSIPVAAGCQHSDDSGPIVIVPKPKD